MATRLLGDLLRWGMDEDLSCRALFAVVWDDARELSRARNWSAGRCRASIRSPASCLSEEEVAYRTRILQEAREGFTGVDALYFSTHRSIHQPLTDEQGMLSTEGWVLDRANNTTLRVAGTEGLDPGALERLAITIVRSAINDFAGEVMLQLFALANDPPNWRRPQLHIQLSDLLDRLGFKRDNRGMHYSDSRRKLSITLLALQLTQIGVQQHASRRGRHLDRLHRAAALGHHLCHAAGCGEALADRDLRAGAARHRGCVYQSAVVPGTARTRRLAGSPLHAHSPAASCRPRRDERGAARIPPALRLLREYVLRCKQAEPAGRWE